MRSFGDLFDPSQYRTRMFLGQRPQCDCQQEGWCPTWHLISSTQLKWALPQLALDMLVYITDTNIHRLRLAFWSPDMIPAMATWAIRTLDATLKSAPNLRGKTSKLPNHVLVHIHRIGTGTKPNGGHDTIPKNCFPIQKIASHQKMLLPRSPDSAPDITYSQQTRPRRTFHAA